MRVIGLLALIIVLCLALSGCWSKTELSDWGFVQAASIDLGQDGSIKLTAHIYKPGGAMNGGMQGGASPSYVDLEAQNSTITGASRSIATELGRRLQWSHMRVLLISEETARRHNLSALLDYFVRNQEMRGSSALMLTHGQASDYLFIKPYIESTMGQQLLEIGRTTRESTGRTVETSLTDMTVISREPVPMLILPFLKIRKEPSPGPFLAGLGVVGFPQGKLAEVLPNDAAPYMLMLMNRFQRGALNIPCKPASGHARTERDSFDISHLYLHMKPDIRGNELTINYQVAVEGTIGELSCGSVNTSDEVDQFTKRIAEVIESKLSDTIRMLQSKKLDTLGIGNYLYRHHHRLWRDWQPSWPDHFAESRYRFKVKVTLLNTGTVTGKTS